MYGQIYMGTPPKKITVVIDNLKYGTILSIDNISKFAESDYNILSSSSFRTIKESYNQNENSKRILAEDNIYLINDIENFDKKEKIEGFKFVFEERQIELNDISILNIGISLFWSNNLDIQSNFIGQLRKEKKLIKTYDITIRYINEKEALLVIGELPHIYDPKNYNYNQLNYAKGLDLIDSSKWILNCNKIYFSKEKESITEKNDRTLIIELGTVINYNIGLIKAPKVYDMGIYKYYFKDKIEKGICFKSQIHLERDYSVYSCDSSKKQELKKDFLPLRFTVSSLLYEFVLDFDDLFKEINGQLFFLIYSDSSFHIQNFEVGAPFLKKYSFSFNYDQKVMGFYNKDIKTQQESMNGRKLTKKDFLLLFIVIIALSIVSFLLGKKLFENAIKRKRANELIDDYDYTKNERLCKGGKTINIELQL